MMINIAPMTIQCFQFIALTFLIELTLLPADLESRLSKSKQGFNRNLLVGAPIKWNCTLPAVRVNPCEEYIARVKRCALSRFGLIDRTDWLVQYSIVVN